MGPTQEHLYRAAFRQRQLIRTETSFAAKSGRCVDDRPDLIRAFTVVGDSAHPRPADTYPTEQARERQHPAGDRQTTLTSKIVPPILGIEH